MTPFASIQRGVDALAAGDTLTIAPGEYFGPVRRDGLGGEDVETVIRAAIPGTVLIRGDVPLPAFRKLDGHRFVYVADVDLDADIQAVIDLDTLTVLRNLPSLPGLDFRPGSFFHVPEENKLYITTVDFSPAEPRRFTASIHNESGFQMAGARRVRLEGFAVTGFRGAGIVLQGPRDCVIRHCRAYLNHSGITVNSQAGGDPMGGGNVIEHSAAWANAGHGLSANVQNDDTIRYSLAYLNGGHGMFLYAGAPKVSRMHDNLGWGNAGGDFFMKSGVSRHQVERCVGPSVWGHESAGSDVRHSLLGLMGRGVRSERIFQNNIQLLAVQRDDPDVDWGMEFADPDNHDYRLQPGSRFRGVGDEGADLGAYPYHPDVYYVSPDGNDGFDGLSVDSAWATLERAGRQLRSGDTLYLLPGRHAGALRLAGRSGEGVINLRGRGLEPVELAGAVWLEQVEGLRVERLRFSAPVTLVGGGDLVFDRCRFTDQAVVSAKGVSGLRIMHSAFESGGGAQLDLSGGSDMFLSGNRFNNLGGVAVAVDLPSAVLYSDYNAYRDSGSAWRIAGRTMAVEALPLGWERYGTAGSDDARMALASGPYGRAAGPYRADPGLTFRLIGPLMHAVGATSANLEWHATHRANVAVEWGTTPECKDGRITDLERFDIEGETFGGFSLTGLQPGTRYYARLSSVDPLDTPRELTRVEWSTEPVEFVTASDYAPGRVFHVAPDGDDSADGLSPERPLRTITRAAALVFPGDTVRIAGGVYHECLHIRATGLPDRPITFSSRLGERVVLDGGVNREMNSLVTAFDKSHLRLDGFYMRNVTGAGPAAGVIRWFGGQDVRITRILQEDRVNGWPAALFDVRRVSDMLFRNCFSLNTMGGPRGRNAPRLRMENCAIVRNRIGGISGGWASHPRYRSVLRNTIVTDCQANKINQVVYPIASSDTLVLQNNAHFLRPERRVQLENVMNMAEFEEQALRDGGLLGDPRFAGLNRTDEDLRRPGFRADGVFGIRGDMTFADLVATNPEFVRRGIGLQPDDFRGFEGGPLSIADLIRLTDELPAQPDAGFGRSYRDDLKVLRDRAAAQPSESLKHELREAFVAADTARQTRRDAELLLLEARKTVTRPYMGDAEGLSLELHSAIDAVASVLKTGSAEIEALRAAELALRAIEARYDVERLIQVRLPASGWRFSTDPRGVGRTEGWFAADHDDRAWRDDVPIESNWQEHMEAGYFGAAWYRATIAVPSIPEKGLRLRLSFYGVDEQAWVWLNGRYAGSHELGPAGWEIPFELDVTDLVKPGQFNHITVMVQNTAGQGGIWKAVYLNVCEQDN